MKFIKLGADIAVDLRSVIALEVWDASPEWTNIYFRGRQEPLLVNLEMELIYKVIEHELGEPPK